jgi:hypothetical protein
MFDNSAADLSVYQIARKAHAERGAGHSICKMIHTLIPGAVRLGNDVAEPFFYHQS